jgi:hypothetical protein
MLACTNCQHTTFYGLYTAIDTLRWKDSGLQITDTDNEGSYERIECARCGAEYEVEAFVKHKKLISLGETL